MIKYDSLIFDFDGTLVDGLDAIIECFSLAFAKFGIPSPPREQVRKKIGLPLSEMYKDLIPSGQHHLINDVIEEYRGCAHEILPMRTYLRPGVKETLVFLKNRGVKLGIATSKATPTTIKTIEHLEVSDFFGAVCGIDQVKHPKPDPEQLLLVLKTLGSQPENSVMIGDTYIDVMAAKATGVFSVVVLDGYGERNLIDDANPDLKIDTIKDITVAGLPFGDSVI